ncbi:MAG: hypothetical protein ACRDM7_13015 [Thermoleophilaceae bacterium]
MSRQLALAAADVEHREHLLGHEARGDRRVHVGAGAMAAKDLAGEAIRPGRAS